MPAKNFLAYFIFCGALTACFSAKAEVAEAGKECKKIWAVCQDESLDFIRTSFCLPEKSKLGSFFLAMPKLNLWVDGSFVSGKLIYKSIDHVRPLYLLFGQLIL